MHEVTYDENLKIIRIRYCGQLTVADLQRGSQEAAQRIIDCQCQRVLVDSREVDFKLSTLEILDLPETFSTVLAELGLELRKIKRALVVVSLGNDYRFLETVAVNRGYWVKLFDNLDEAEEWLFE